MTLALLAVFAVASAQSEFKKVWEMKASAPNKWNDQTPDLSRILMGDLKVIEMIDGTTGKSLWTFDVKAQLGVKSMEDWFFLWAKEGEPVEVVYKKPKEDAKTSVYLNSTTGKIESSITEATLVDKAVKVRSKKIKTIFANSCVDEASATTVSITYKDKKLKSALGGSDMDLTVNSSGGNNWTAKFTAKCVRHLCDELLSSYEPDMMVNVSVSNGKVFVVYEGVTVFDLKTGKQLWSTTFDNVQTSVGLKAKQEIGRSPMPVSNENAVFICDFSKGEKAIKKLDINTGAELWRSEKLSSDDVISQLIVTGNTLVAKMGGIIRVEKFIPDANGGIGDGTYKVNYEYEGTSEIRGYDLATGRFLRPTTTLLRSDPL